MTGSRLTSTRHGDQSPLDALSRTIEGLEARIEGLMGAAGRKDPARSGAPAARTEAADWPRDAADVHQASPSARRFNPVDEILERQRSLEAGRGPVAAPSPRPPLGNRRPAVEPTRASAPMPAAAHAAQPDIADTLQALRHELKRDIADGVAREMTAMRNDLRALKADASDPRYASEIRSELAHLADRVDRLSAQAAPRQAEELRAEFQGLRAALDSMARQDDVNRMQDHLALFENRMQALDGINVKDDIMALAYRIDDIKMQISSLNASPAVHALEDKLMIIAGAVEQLGNHMRPDHSIDEQFAALNSRMEDIAAALVEGSHQTRHPEDSRMIERLDDRIAGLASQIDGISRSLDSRPGETDVLAARIEAMAERIEDLANIEAAARLEERLDHLAQLIEQSQAFGIADGIGDYLTEISSKIDAIGGGELSDAITARLDALARQIDELQMPPAAETAFDGAAIQRLEDRLAGIAKRLDEQSARPAAAAGLETLEEQIANLSALMQDLQPAGGNGLPSDFDQRMAAIEDYITTNDEYIIEAARQAAESVLDAYARSGGQSGGADMSALVGLTQDLKNLEAISRNSEERTQQTFGALHETLIQIAERLDHLDAGIRQGGQSRAPASREFEREAAPQFAAESEMAFDDAADEPRDFGHRREEDVAFDRNVVGDVATLDEPAQKASLLSGIGKRFMPTRKEERTPIEPTPSIDPGDDVIDSDEGNLLLEPGSGAPDVKKIMARVRASQKKERPAGQDIEPGTPDYIAAARRAAQAAAMEVEAARDDQDKPRAPKVKKGKTKAAAPEKGKAEKKTKVVAPSDGTSIMAKYRRPVLLAAGAVLLVVMAMPLVNTLLHGAKAPQIEEQAIAPAEAPATATMDAPQADAPAAPEATTPQADQMQETAPADAAPIGDKSELAPLPQDGGQDDAAAGAVNDAPQPAMAEMKPDAEATTASAAPAATDTQPEIVVPSEISPPSLVEAAKGGDPLALFEIGARYSEGRGLKTSMEQAAVWYKLSADRGFAPAEYRLANLYEKGTGVATDMNKAREYYEKAAEAGNASSMHNLAVLLASGAFGAPDFGAAATWFEKAANMGVADSQFNLAILYARGSGVKQSLEDSYKWFAIAAKDGDKDAAQKRDEVANAMRPDQIDAAKAEVELWKPEPLDDNANSIEVPDEWAGKGLKTATVDMGKAIRNIQALLNKNGFDAGPVDGQMGGKTVAAIKAFQTKHGQEPTGKITDDFVREILALNK